MKIGLSARIKMGGQGGDGTYASTHLLSEDPGAAHTCKYERLIYDSLSLLNNVASVQK